MIVTAEWKTRGDFERPTRDRHIAPSAEGLTLVKRVVVADEMGNTTRRLYEALSAGVLARKEFALDFEPACSGVLSAHLLADDEDEASPVEFRVNGRSFRWQPEAPVAYWRKGWAEIALPSGALRRGLNEVVIAGGEGGRWRLTIENSRWPNRSAKSVDGGRSWDYDHLGLNNSCDGEYLVRLALNCHPGCGAVTSEVVDLGALAGEGGIPPAVRLTGLEVAADSACPAGTDVGLEVRVGSTPQYDPAHWTAFAAPGALPLGEAAGWPAPHAQWRATLNTTDPAAAPALRRVALRADIEIVSSAGGVHLVSLDAPRVRMPSHRFAFQRSDEPRLAVLRERHHLDDVVAGAKSHWDQACRLRQWARDQWRDGWNKEHGALRFSPPWNALLILDLAGRGMSQGMCTHYSTVFVQACLALGFQARHVISRAHCTAEVWSEDFGKWALMDPGGDMDDARRFTYHFERDGVPMSALEVHRAHLARDLAGVAIAPAPPGEASADHPFTVEKRALLFDRFCIPLRNDFLTSQEPGEPEHGTMWYQYDGYLWWQDEETPPLPRFSLHTSREADLYWSVDVTDLRLGAGPSPGALRVHLASITPNFECFEAAFDEGEWSRCESEFDWPLHRGENRLRARAVNAFGRPGPAAQAVVRA